MLSTQKHTTPLGNYDVPTGWPMKPYKRPYGRKPGPPVMYEKPSDPEEENARYGYSNGMSQQERNMFYYHSDHLGSTSYITDKDGNATQFVSYKPYGEALVDEHATSFESPWKFNGKELDSETGLYYYGARYYMSVLAMWYGVDALAEKYPNMGGYVYCVGNPVRLVDVDGNDWITAEYEGETFYYYDERVKSENDIISMYYYGDEDEARNYYNISYFGSESQNDWYGNYAGANNPKIENEKDSYAIPPIDDLDYAGFVHDKAYDRVGAIGASDAFLNMRTIGADYELGIRSYKAYGNNATSYKNKGYVDIMIFSYTITGLKEMRR